MLTVGAADLPGMAIH